MKKILVTSSSASLSGGGQQSTLLFLKKLNKEKYKPIVFLSQEGDFVGNLKKINVTTIIESLPSINPFTCVLIFFKLRKILKKHAINLIHTESSRATFYFGFAKLFLKIPLIWHVRVSNREPYVYERLLYQLSNKIVVVSKSAGARFSKFRNYEKKVNIIFNAVDIQVFNHRVSGGLLKKELNQGLDKVLIGIIGEVVPLKGQIMFLKAAQLALKENKNLHFVIIGQGDQDYRKKMLNFIVELDIEKSVHVLNFRDNISGYMKDLDILVNASTVEGFSRVIIEGMALGIPVIATNVGGNSEAVVDNETGFLINTQAHDQLKNAIIKLSSNTELRIKMGIKGVERVLKCFNVDEQIVQIERVYKELLNEG